MIYKFSMDLLILVFICKHIIFIVVNLLISCVEDKLHSNMHIQVSSLQEHPNN